MGCLGTASSHSCPHLCGGDPIAWLEIRVAANGSKASRVPMLTRLLLRAKFAPQNLARCRAPLGFSVFPVTVEGRSMLRDDGHQPEEAPTALSAEARLLLRGDHVRGLHLAPANDCDLCTPAEEQAVPGGTVPAIS